MANTKTAKKAAKKTAKPRRTATIQVGSARQEESRALITLYEGIPNHYLKSTEGERKEILDHLTKLKPNKNHFVLPARLKGTVLRLAKSNFPAYKLRTSSNKTKKTVSVWRTA